MFGLTRLTGAVRSLADNLLALSQTVAEANQGLRRRLRLDGPDAPEAPALPGAPQEAPRGARRNGKARAGA